MITLQKFFLRNSSGLNAFRSSHLTAPSSHIKLSQVVSSRLKLLQVIAYKRTKGNSIQFLDRSFQKKLKQVTANSSNTYNIFYCMNVWYLFIIHLIQIYTNNSYYCAVILFIYNTFFNNFLPSISTREFNYLLDKYNNYILILY